MPEITVPSTINTKFDPDEQILKNSRELGIKPLILADNKFSLTPQKDELNSFSKINASEYGKDISLFSSDSEASSILNEQRAQSQGAAEQLLKGLGHLASTVGTEILKTPGYIGGALASPVMEGSLIDNIVDNQWLNAFDSLDQSIKDQMPIYITKEVEEGNIGRKLLSSAWWATTGAEGIGFMLSMFAPGQALKAIGLGAKVGKGLEVLAKESKLAKAVTAGILKNTPDGLKMTANAMKRIDSTAAVALNTYVESAAEAANTFDNVKKEYLQRNPNASDEEANKIAGDYAAKVMKANIGVLALSNVFDELFLFKGFAGGAEQIAKDSVFGKIFTNGIINSDEVAKLSRKGVKDFIKQAPLKIGSNFVKEGLFEEGLQTKIQQHYEAVASGKTNASFTEEVLGDYFESLFNDPEMQEAVVLGGILGSGASMFGLASDIKAENEMLYGKQSYTPSAIGKFFGKKEKQGSKGLLNIMNENFINSTRTIHDIAEKDGVGNLVTENGKLKINEGKLKELVEQKQGLLLLNQLHNIAILEGNKNEEEYFGDLLSFNYFMPFLEQDGGFEVLNEHISNQLVDLMVKKSVDAGGKTPTDQEKELLKTKLLNKAKEYKNIYDTVNQTTNTEIYVPVDLPEIYSGWKSSVRNKKLQSLVSYNSASKALAELELKFPEGTDVSTLSPDKFVEFKLSEKVKDEYKKRIEDSKNEFARLSNKDTLLKDYEDYKKGIEEDVKLFSEVVKESEKEKETKIEENNSIETLKNQAINAGYNPDEIVILEDIYGDRYKFDPVTGQIKNVFGRVVKNLEGPSIIKREALIKEQEELEKLKESLNNSEEFKKISNLVNNYEEKYSVVDLLDEIKTLFESFETLYKDRTFNKISKNKKLHRVSELNKLITKLENLQSVLVDRLNHLKQLPLNDQSIITNLEQTLSKVASSLNNLKYQKVSSDLLKQISLKGKKTLDHLSNLYPNTPYNFLNFLDKKTIFDIFAGKTTLKNNLNTNINKPNGKDIDPINIDVLNDLVKLFKDYSYSKEGEAFVLTPEGIDINNYDYITNNESDELYNDLTEILKFNNSEYTDFRKNLLQEINEAYHEVSEKILDKTVDPSQKESGLSAEPLEVDSKVDDVFLQHNLPLSPFVTTGISVRYDNKGKDIVDENGYPQLTGFTSQKLWFETIDELSSSIGDYYLKPVKAIPGSNDEIQQAIKLNFTDPSKIQNTDVFVFLVDKNGDYVKKDGFYIFTSLKKPSTVFPENSKPKIPVDYIINNYLLSLGLPPVESFDEIRNQKITNFVYSKSARAKLKELIEIDGTGADLYILAVEQAKREYTDFINSLLNNTDSSKVLPIETVSKGYALYQLDKEGKKNRRSVFESFPVDMIHLSNQPGTSQLVGGKLGVIVNADLKVKNEFLKLDKGLTYLHFDDNTVIPLEARKLNDTEVNTVLYLLSLAHKKDNLNTVTIPTKNGYNFNGKTTGKNLPVFFKKSKTNEQAFSLLETLINYGLRKDTKNKKGEIYIQSGKVMFTTFDNVVMETPLQDLYLAIQSNDFSKIQPLVDFLKEKRFNIHNLLVSTNPTFIYPKYENGKLTVDESKTYYEFILSDVLSSTAIVKQGYPKRLQRNVVFKPELTTIKKSNVPSAHTTSPPPTIDKPVQKTKEQLMKANIDGFKKMLPQLGNPSYDEMLSQLSESANLKNTFKKYGHDLTYADIETIVKGIFDIKEEPVVAETPITEDVVMKTEYKGLPIINTEDIINNEGQKGAAQYNRDEKIIKVNRLLLKEKFNEKAWTKPRILIETIHGEKIESSMKSLPEDQFKDYQEFETFVIEHEYQHSIYSRKDFDKEFPGKTIGDYESEINDRAIKALDISQTTKENKQDSEKLSNAERLKKLKGEKSSIKLTNTPSADKLIDPDKLLDYYIQNNTVQKICK